VSLCPQLRQLAAEHARWLLALGSRAEGDQAGRGDRLLALWDAEILPHCRAEEEVLLPALAQRLCEADAVIVFTTGDHLVLRGLARDLRLATGTTRDAAAATFAAKLASHLIFEERTLLPALQETLGCARLAELEGELTEAGSSRTPRPADGPLATTAARTIGSAP